MKCCVGQPQSVLAVVMVIGSVISTVFLTIALASDHLVSCYEKQSKDLTLDNVNYLATNFGLWRACSWLTDRDGVKITSALDLNCVTLSWRNVDVHTSRAEGVDEQITSSIVGHPMMKVVFALMLLGLCMQIAGHVAFLAHQRFPKRNFCMFSTGGCYVFSGLSLLAATILFMSKVTEESLHQKELAKGVVPQFRYSYGTSFMMLAASFVVIEVCGILAVYIFIVRYKEAYKNKHIQHRNNRPQSALWQSILNRTNSQTADRKPVNLSSSSQRLEIDKTTPQDSSPSVILQLRKKQEYTKIVNSESADSKLGVSDGCTNHGLFLHHNGRNNSACIDQSAMTSNGTIVSVESFRREEVRILSNESEENLSVFIPDGIGDFVDNMGAQVIPPPPTFNSTCLRKVTTTV